jgi:WD40 repeat protein
MHVQVVKSTVYMYIYDLEDFDQVDDLNRLASRGRYELIHHWDLPCQSITTFSCLNTIQSPIIMVASSDKKIYLLDALRGEISQSLDSGHDRSVHDIALPRPSAHVSLPLDTPEYNLFATSAIDNVISLWDIRSPRVIMRYSKHVNRREAIGCSISPCLRYLATGSEDNSARIIDLRNASNELSRLTGHRDVVMDVQWHPIQSQLATASLDGSVRFYHSHQPDIEQTSSTTLSRRHRLAS